MAHRKDTDSQHKHESRERSAFCTAARTVAKWTGKPAAFLIAVTVVLALAATGYVFDFSDTWQLVINTGTTIVTFLMVFLIQNTQNSDTYAMQLKLDELIRVTKGAQTTLLDLEELGEDDLLALRDRYEELAAEARKKSRKGGKGKSSRDLGDIILQ